MEITELKYKLNLNLNLCLDFILILNFTGLQSKVSSFLFGVRFCSCDPVHNGKVRGTSLCYLAIHVVQVAMAVTIVG